MINVRRYGNALRLAAILGLAATGSAVAGDRLILDPGPTPAATGSGTPPASSADDIDRRVHDLEEQKTNADRKSSHPVTLDVSGTVLGQVQATKR